MSHHHPVTGETLSQSTLRAAAGEASYARGQDYVRYVTDLEIVDGTASASIEARNSYRVDLEWTGRRPVGRCTCPHHARGHFCKHLVALGLAVLESDGGPAAAHGSRSPALREAGEGTAGPEELVALASQMLSARGFVDYGRAFDVAQDAQALLHVLEDRLAACAPDTARPALLRALTRLRAISLRADDSGGSIGDACQRTADLYARSCREGNPDRVKLARWLVTFRDDSPGWPVLTLADFAAAFDERALRAYRLGVEQLVRKHAGEDYWARHEVELMRLELADHDGDVDLAVTLLAQADTPQYAAIVDRLRLAGRIDEVTTWVDRAVADGNVSREHARAGRSFWLDPDEVAGEYLALDRVDDAVGVFRSELVRRPEPATFAALMKFAAMVDREAEEREWALGELRAQATAPFGTGAVLVQLAMADRDLEQAWAYAEELGPGHAWQALAAASVKDHPGRAAGLHRARLEKDLWHPDAKLYPAIAATLATVRDLSLAAGEEREFAAYLAQLRATYKRRPALMAALTRRGLQ